MIQCEFTLCSIDELEKDLSPAYRSLFELDPAAAEASLYTLLVPKDDDG